MKLQISPLAQLKSIWSVIVLILIVWIVLIGAVNQIAFKEGIEPAFLTRDAADIAVLACSETDVNAVLLSKDITKLSSLPCTQGHGFPIYVGFVSQIGILSWAASAAICFFSLTLLSKKQAGTAMNSFFLVSGLLTLLLGLDDAFLFHERVFPYFGIRQTLVYLGYIGFMLYYLIRFFPVILKTEYILLVIALVFFGGSVGMDIISDRIIANHNEQVFFGMNEALLEDSMKLLGILSWLSYFFRTGMNAAVQPINE